ncbi:MAG TPA: molecular chaperone Hsp20 [Treponema sp.]|nr:molecular chaperone Hsp20 [Treponema sp.]
MNGLSLIDALFDGMDNACCAAAPSVDVRETDGAYILDMDLPGRNENDIELTLKEGVLSIASAGQKKPEERDAADDMQWLVRERRHGDFSRSFTLPDDIDGNDVSAVFKNGVLTVTIPRRKEARLEKKIAIQAA